MLGRSLPLFLANSLDETQVFVWALLLGHRCVARELFGKEVVGAGAVRRVEVAPRRACGSALLLNGSKLAASLSASLSVCLSVCLSL